MPVAVTGSWESWDLVQERVVRADGEAAGSECREVWRIYGDMGVFLLLISLNFFSLGDHGWAKMRWRVQSPRWELM